MNSKITKVSLALLRSALWGDISQVNENDFPTCRDEWKSVEIFFARQSLDGLLPDAIASLPATQQPSMAVKMPMIARQLQVEHMNRAMNKELRAFTAELNRRAIPYILMKGQGVSTLYPNPMHRTCGDIDLYVPKEHLKNVHRGLQAFGAIRDHENVHHVCYHARGIVWELHHSICYFQKEKREQMFMHYVKKAMQETPYYTSIEDGQVRVLPPTINVILLLAHIVDHFYCEGVGLRQLCDYALLLCHKHDEINQSELVEILEALSMARAYRVFGYICTHYLGMPSEALLQQPSKKEIDLAHRVMANCLHRGNFGHANAKRRHSAWQKILFYVRYFYHLWQFRQLHPSEALWWPLAKLKRALKGEVHISEERSAVNRRFATG